MGVAGVYVSGDLTRKLEKVGEWPEEEGKGRILIIGGNFNAKTGEEEGGRWQIEEQIEKQRSSKGKKINGEGRLLLDFTKERGWEILNENIQGDRKETLLTQE